MSLAGQYRLTASHNGVKDKYNLPPWRAVRRGPRLSQWQLNDFLIKGELVRLNGNLMQIWSRNDSQWIITEDGAAEQKPCNSSRDCLMHSFTPNKFWRQNWIYSHSNSEKLLEESISSMDTVTYPDNWIYRYTATEIYDLLVISHRNTLSQG